MKLNVGLVGGTGYTGVELLRLLAQHPNAALHCITSRKDAGAPVTDFFPSLRGHPALDKLVFCTPDEARLTECDVVFFATPHGVAMGQAETLLAAGVKIIDLAADFRLQDAAEFERWYKMPHACPHLLKEAVYGLPEVNREAIRKARIVGNPGCYPTAVQLGFLPLLEAGIVATNTLIADCKSGVSGAGRVAELSKIFPEVTDNFIAYGVAGHRHHPETEQGLRRIAGQPVQLTFTPHLVPMIRGIFATLYATLTDDSVDVQALFEQRYANEPFVDVLPAGRLPETRSVRTSNMVRIAVVRRPSGVTVLVVEDNLVKGAAGQAVQNMNLMFGLPETVGLTALPVSP
ncbi:MAG: N-acetyl-gamma-glutamyl-phosphate reductase [Burkholderiales bacterium]|jgi:N-acetyl-gamma-glutamyl-phosphate reductase|nr:N-acetyl-gamma-glutamyl-phosphate reductase [Burkholderiales bacterium]